MQPEHLVVLCTCPDQDTAETIAGELVASAAAACVNIVPGLTSVYQWEGKVQRDQELLLIAKTTPSAYPRLEETVRRLHPYELPEIIAVPVVFGLAGYLSWVSDTTKREDR